MKHLKRYNESKSKVLYLTPEDVEEIKFLFKELADEYNLFNYDDNDHITNRTSNYYIFFLSNEEIKYTSENTDVFYISIYIDTDRIEAANDINNLLDRLKTMDFKVYVQEREKNSDNIYYHIQIFKYDYSLQKSNKYY